MSDEIESDGTKVIDDSCEFRVYRVNPILGLGIPLLITTVTTLSYERWKGEYFLLTQNKTDFPWKRISIDARVANENGLLIDREFVETQLIDTVERLLLDYIESVADKGPSLLYQVQVSRVENRSLYGYCLGDFGKTQLPNVMDETVSDTLNKYLRLIKDVVEST